MHIQTIRTIAKQHGIKVSRMGKANMIRSIQRSEGNFDCFDSAREGHCDQALCSWRDDCLSGNKKRRKQA
ncbi:MAG: SAP domain-containing protein [Pseudomonadota bacterium]